MLAVRELGKKIRATRRRKGISLRALGAAIGKSHGWVLNLERGEIQKPAAEDLTAIARELGEDPEVYLQLAGRVSLAAAQIVPARDGMPEWARRLETKIDALSESLALTKADVDGSAQGLAELLGLVRQGQPPGKKRVVRVAGRPAVRRRASRQESGSPK